MDLLIIVFIVILIASGLNARAASQDTQNKLKELGRTCPPHKWRYEEVKDHEGVVHAWKMVCDVCGPLKPQDTPPRMDY